MKGVIRSLITSAVLVSLWGHPEPAWAQKRQRVLVERFSGPGTVVLRKMVLICLDRQKAEVVGEDGRPTVIISGSVTPVRRAFAAVVQAKDPQGRPLTKPGVWLGRTVRGALEVAVRNIERKVAVALAATPGGPVAEEAG